MKNTGQNGLPFWTLGGTTLIIVGLTIITLIKSIGLSYSLLTPIIGSFWAIILLIIGVLILFIGGGMIMLYKLLEKANWLLGGHFLGLIFAIIGLIFQIKILILLSGFIVTPVLGFFVLLLLGVIGMTVGMEKDYGVDWH